MKKLFTLIAAAVVGLSTAAFAAVTPPPEGTLIVNADFDNGQNPFTDGTLIALQCFDNNGGNGYFFNGAAAKTATFTDANLFRVVAYGDRFKLQSVAHPDQYVSRASNDDEALVTMSDKDNADSFVASLSNVANAIRFASSVSGSTQYLNTNNTALTPKYFTGTGGFSYWYVYKFPQEPTGWTRSETALTKTDIQALAGQEKYVVVKASAAVNTGWFKPYTTNEADGTGFFATCETTLPETTTEFTNEYVYKLIVDENGNFTFRNCHFLYPPIASERDHAMASKVTDIAEAGFFTTYDAEIQSTSQVYGRYIFRTTNKTVTGYNFLDLHFDNDQSKGGPAGIWAPKYFNTGTGGLQDPNGTGKTISANLIYLVDPVYAPSHEVTLKFTGVDGTKLSKTITTIKTDANELLDGNCPEYFTATGIEGDATISDDNTEFTIAGTWDYPFILNKVFRADVRLSTSNCTKWAVNDNNEISTRNNANAGEFDPKNLFYFKGHGYNSEQRLLVSLHSIAFSDSEGFNNSSTGGSTGTFTSQPTVWIVKTTTYGGTTDNGIALQHSEGSQNAHANDIQGKLGVWDAAIAQNSDGSFIRFFDLTESDYALENFERDGVFYNVDPALMAAAKANPTSENVRAIFENGLLATSATLTVNLTYNGRTVKTVEVTGVVGTEHTIETPDFFTDEAITVTIPATNGTVTHALTGLELPFRHTETTDNMVWQAVRIKPAETGKFLWTYNANASNANKLVTNANNSNEIGFTDAQLWAFVGNMADGFKIYNKEAGMDMWLYKNGDNAIMGNSEENCFWHPSPSVVDGSNDFTATNTYCCLTTDLSQSNAFINLQQSNTELKFWSKDHGSSQAFIAPAEPLIERASSLVLEDYVGPENAVGAINYGDLDNVAARTLIEQATADKYNLEYAEQLRTLIFTYDDYVSIKPLVPNGYYRIQSILSGDMIYTASFDDNGQVDNGLRLTGYEGDAHRQDYHTIFKFEPVAGQTERYHLLSQGLYVGQATGHAQPIMQVEADGDRGEYSLAHSNHDSDPTINSSAAWILRDETHTNTDKNFFHQSQGTSHIQAYGQFAHGSHFYILEAEHIDVNLVANADTMKIGFGYFPFPVYATDAQTKLYHLHASTDKATNEPVITFKQVDAIEAHTAFMVSHPDVDSEKVTLAIGQKAPAQVRRRAESETDDEADEADETNLLGGHLRQTQVEAGNYVFGTISDNKLGFSKLDNAAAVAGNFAYIPAANLSAAQAANAELPLVDRSNTTGIRELSAQGQARQVIYDLQGRRLSAPIKGINIINGRKALLR